jgi:hypothetical protein
MRLISSALCTTVAVALLAGCSGMSQTTPSGPSSVGQTQSHFSHGRFIPHWSYPANVMGIQQGAAPRYHEVLSQMGKKHGNGGGIYASEFLGTSIWGYQHKNTANNPPTCSTGPVSSPNGIAVDGKGNLIDPDGGTRSVIIFGGPGMCGAEVGSFSDPYGQPSDASSPDAVNGTVAVGNIFDTSGAGSVSVCTMSGGCTSNLTNPNMYEVAGVAMDNSGNCWASATNSAGTATLTYFAGCTGSGQAATGYMNTYYGGLDIDKNGNLVSVSAFNSALYVYSGCNPACTLVGGPFTMTGEAVFGHLNKQSMTYCAGDFLNGQMDVYYYSPSALTYWYSFNNGLTASYDPEGCAYNPRSAQ